MISKRRFSLPRLDITGMWVFSLGVWFHIVARLVYSKPWMAFFLAELIAAILVLFGAYQVLDAWIARVSLEEREALEARQQAMMEGQQEGGHVSHYITAGHFVDDGHRCAGLHPG